MKRVDVSIIIPVYNVQEYLSNCLDSVVNQTIENKEIIIINDGSTDNCYEIMKEYKMKFPEIIIINQKNKGISETRNVGLKTAKGEYIAFVDSDDFIELDMFEQMYRAAKRENADIVSCNYILYNPKTDEQNTDEYKTGKYETKKYITGEYVIEGNDKEGHIDKIEILKKFLSNEVKAYVWNKLHKRELFMLNKVTFPNFVVCEDTPVAFLLLARSKNIFCMNQPLYYYRQRESSLTKIFSIKAMEDILNGCFIMRDYIKKDPLLYEELMDYYKVYMIKTLWVIHNKYWLRYCETGEKSNYQDFKKVVSKEVENLKISEILSNRELDLKYKVTALLIKTKTYGFLFTILYKLRNIKKQHH